MPERYLGKTLGKYRIESLLGSGGFAWVFKGYDPELDIPVAVKVLKPQFAGDQNVVDRFRREASTAARLRHPNIIKIYAVGREGDAVYFVMDYLPSGLANRLESAQSLSEDYVLRVGVDVARALGFAHREGVIHRDIKVDNILFDTHGNAVVADFGIARALSGYTNQTGTNMVVGTPQYFAPEQARAKPLDGRADLYSLGVTLYRASTGRLPFEGEDWYEIARQHVEEAPPSPRSVNPALSPQFEAILLQCLAKSPDDRPPTGEVLAEAMQEILQARRDPSAASTVTVPSSGATPVSERRLRVAATPSLGRRRLVTGAIAAAIVVGGVVALLALPIGPDGLPTAATDSLGGPDTAGAGDSTLVFPPAVVTESAPPKGSAPAPRGGSTPKAPASAPTVGSIRVTAPAEATISVDGVEVGFGSVRKDSLQPGQHSVRAVYPTNIEGCDAASITRLVTVGAGATVPVQLNPRPCGILEIEVVARRGDQPVSGTIWYSVQAEGVTDTPRDTPLTPGGNRDQPVRDRKVLAVGSYRLRVKAAGCADFDDAVEILAGETRREAIRLLC